MILGHLRNVSFLLRAQRSSRHKNCRIGGLMFDNQHTQWRSQNRVVARAQVGQHVRCCALCGKFSVRKYTLLGGSGGMVMLSRNIQRQYAFERA